MTTPNNINDSTSPSEMNIDYPTSTQPTVANVVTPSPSSVGTPPSDMNIDYPTSTQPTVANVATPSSSSVSITSCIMCKILGQKCDEDCQLLTPFFPLCNVEKQNQAKKVLVLFGRERIINHLKSVDSMYHYDAITSMISTADTRARDPVGGCKGVIDDLLRDLNKHYDELRDVSALLAARRGGAAPVYESNPRPPYLTGDVAQDSQLLLNLLPLSESLHPYSSGKVFHDMDHWEDDDVGPERIRRRTSN